LTLCIFYGHGGFYGGALADGGDEHYENDDVPFCSHVRLTSNSQELFKLYSYQLYNLDPAQSLGAKLEN